MIQLESVSYWYPGSRRPALSDFTLQVQAGEVVGLAGPNESGKTTACLDRKSCSSGSWNTSVRAEVDFGASSPAAVREALAATGLAGREADHPYDLGYSRRKLLTIAAVLAMETPIVLLDEPTLGQDAAGRALIIGILRRLQAAGRTVIVAGHDRALMAATLDRTVTLAAGRLI